LKESKGFVEPRNLDYLVQSLHLWSLDDKSLNSDG
jgi:hypothetical protein